jgi:hypothetical protein
MEQTNHSASKGYVYILVNPAFTGFVKIGKTIKDPEIRAKELSCGTGIPAPFSVVWDILVDNCDEVERLIHRELSSYRARNDREFFSLSPKQAISAVRKLAGPYACEDEVVKKIQLASDLPKVRKPVRPHPASSPELGLNQTPPTRNEGLTRVSSLCDGELAPNVDVYVNYQLSEIVRLVLEVCPDCLYKLRNDSAMIFVPPERADSGTRKNLMTVWPKKKGVRLRIMPDPVEKYIDGNVKSYKERLLRLYSMMQG